MSKKARQVEQRFSSVGKTLIGQNLFNVFIYIGIHGIFCIDVMCNNCT